MPHVVVMVTTSYPRFPGDAVGTFMEPIATGVAARGHEVHVVAPWHPLVRRGAEDGGVRFHFFRYAPLRSLNVFGYANALRADVRLRFSAFAVAPLALASGWRLAARIARERRATIVHGHWVIPGGAMAAAAAGGRPLVVSLHGSDVFVAERHRLARTAATATFRRAGWVTACSADLRDRALALGADRARIDVVPYGVDADRFKPDAATRAARRASLGIAENDPVVFAAGRLVRKKGFEYLIDAAARLAAAWPRLVVVLAGAGDLDGVLRARAAAHGMADRVRFLGVVDQADVAGWLTAADLAVVPSVRDEAGNVDGLPNVVMEALASGTALVATPAGGIGAVAEDGVTASVVPERNESALAAALDALLRDPGRRAALGRAARDLVRREHTWARVAERFEQIYDAAARPDVQRPPPIA